MDYSKKSKEELISEIERLKQKEQNIELVLKETNEFVYRISFDQEKKITINYISPKIEKIIGLTNEEYINNHSKLYEQIHPDDIPTIVKEVEKLKKSKKPAIFTYRFFNKLLSKYVWLEETLVNTYSSKGKRNGFFGSVRDVTNTKEAENNLSFILNNISECIYNIKFEKNDKKLMYISPQIQELTGLTIEEYNKEGKSGKLIMRIHPQDLQRVSNSIDKYLYKEKTSVFNHSFRFKPKGKKEYIWLDETIHANYDKQGNLLETTTVVRDITEKRNFEESIRLSEKSYKELFNFSPNFLYIKDRKGKFLDVNETVLNTFGLKREDIIGKKSDAFNQINKNNPAQTDKLIEKAWKGKPQQFLWWGIDKNGDEILEDIIIKKTKYFNQEVIIGVGRNVTQKFKTEEILKQSEAKYKNLIENSPFGVIIHDNGKLLYSNQKANDIFGYNPKKHKIKTSEIQDFLLPEYKPAGLKRRENVLKGAEEAFVNVKVKSPFNGKTIELQTRAVLIDYLGNKAIQVVFQDISSEKELVKERLKNQIAEESNRFLQKEVQHRLKIERELLNNQNYISSLISSSLDVICSSDERGRIKEFNRAAEKTFGYSKKDMESLNTKALYATDKEFEKVSKSLKKTGNFIGEVLNRRKNGEQFVSFLSASVLYSGEGKLIGTMGVSRDITDFKLAKQELKESEERYRDLFENALDLIQSVSVDGSIIYVNNAWKNTLGYTDKEVLGKNIISFVHPDGAEHCIKLLKNLKKSKQNTSVCIELAHKNGSKVIVEGLVGLKINKSGKVVSTRGIFRNITEERWAKQLQEVYNNISVIVSEKSVPEEIYESIRKELRNVMNTEIFAISYAVNENTIAFPYYYDITRGGVLKIETRSFKKGLNEYFLSAKKSKILHEKEFNKLINDGKCELIGPPAKVFVGVPLKVKNKVVGVLSVQSYHDETAYNEKSLEALDMISGVLGMAVQKKYDEQKLFEQSSKLNSIIENSSHLFWTYDNEMGLTSFNKNYSDAIFDLYGYTPKLGGHTKNRVHNESLQPFWDKKYNQAFEGKKVEFITHRTNTKGNLIIREVFLNPIVDENNRVIMVSGIAHDITEKFVAEENLKKSLKEKEVLLKEVHHRVKNNLQVVSSILNLQSSYVEDKKTINILRESQDRIKTMSIIHENLYQTNDYSKINFSQYIISLSKNLVHSYVNFDTFVDVEYKVDEVNLSLDLSIPCGLIVNELVSNSLKYAFKGRKKGKLFVGLELKKNIVTLTIKDDGVGLPKNFKIEEINSLGLQLVTALVEQIDGKIELQNKKGTTITITFKQIQ